MFNPHLEYPLFSHCPVTWISTIIIVCNNNLVWIEVLQICYFLYMQLLFPQEAIHFFQDKNHLISLFSKHCKRYNKDFNTCWIDRQKPRSILVLLKRFGPFELARMLVIALLQRGAAGLMWQIRPGKRTGQCNRCLSFFEFLDLKRDIIFFSTDEEIEALRNLKILAQS